ncbi:hypothetical protein D6D01_07488 [Aureobasidium pullulans]|uniref:Uncharacterized protein n=1 Tax=Aureobasidium pullulans TaxID=5580 RepID=A0A4S9KMT0_AURPU|nr:hypothetical protein D6D01_07488 [Aureobasidium pullulans]
MAMVKNNTINNGAAKSRNSSGNASRRGSNHKKQPAGNGSNAAGSTQQGRALNDHAAFPSQAKPGVNTSQWSTGNKQKGKQNKWTAPQNNQHKPQQSSSPVRAMQATPHQPSTALNPASIPFETSNEPEVMQPELETNSSAQEYLARMQVFYASLPQQLEELGSKNSFFAEENRDSTEKIKLLEEQLKASLEGKELPPDAKLVKSNAAKDEQIKKLKAEVTVARQVEKIAKEEEQKNADLIKTLREQLADAEQISAPTEGDATAAGPELQKIRKELIAARRLEDINKKGHEETLKLKDKQIKSLTQGQDFALQAEVFAKKKQREVEARLKKYEQKSQGKVVTSGTVVKLTDAELEIITRLESDNKELREQISKIEAELTASQRDAIASKLQEASLRQQLEISKIETTATMDSSASVTSADSTTNARVITLESDNKTLRDQATRIQAELSTARSTAQEAIKQKLEIETQTQVQALNTQVAQHQVDLNAARVAEQAAISRETAAITKSKDLRSQLAAAQKKARPHDTIDIAVAVRTSGLMAEKKDLREQLIKTREQLSAAHLAELPAVVSANSMVVQLETAEVEIQKLRERLDLAPSKTAETTKTTASKTPPVDTATTATAADQADINALQDGISQREKELQSSRNSVEATEANKNPPHEDVSKLQSEVERLSRQISLTISQEAAARLAEDKAIERAATAKSDAESLRSEVVFLRESVSRTQREQIPLREKIDKADQLLKEKDSIIRRYQQRHVAGTHTNNATSETEETTSGQEKKATVYIRYRNPEEVADLEKQVRDAQAEQKTTQDEAARLRAAADVLQVNLDKNITATAAGASTTNSEVNIKILKLRTEVDELKSKLNTTVKSSTKEGEPNSDPSRTLLEGQLMFAKALLKSSENEKAISIAETIRLRKELATYKQFEVSVHDTVDKGRKDFETLEAQLRKTKKQLRKYTGDVKKPKETTAGAVEETSKLKTKASHLLIQTNQLATLKEKDKQIEDIRLAAGWAHTKLTKTIVAQNDEIRKLKKNMKLPSHASKALAHDGGTPIVYAQPAPHLLHIPSKDVQTTIDAEIAQSRQAFEDIRLKRANAFSSWQLEQAGLLHREQAWETLEKETFKEQQDLREELQVRKEALIRKARLAEDQLQTSLKLKKQQEAARAASEEQTKPTTEEEDASPPEAHKGTLLKETEEARNASAEQVKPPTGELHASLSEALRKVFAEARQR